MSILKQIITQISHKNLLPATTTFLSRSFHILNQIELKRTPYVYNRITNLLNPFVVNLMPTCGFKVHGKLKRRCKDCYFVRRHERLYVICKTHPRHKQMSMVKDERNTWILTHATQSKFRPW